MKRILVFVFLTTLATAPSTVHAGLADPAYEALAERRPEEAARLLRTEVVGGKASAERHYLLARAEFLTKNYDAAITAADNVRERFPKSPFARKAHFLKADCLLARKDFKTADEIYIAEAKVLVSLERKEEVAQLYLKIADRAFAPPTKDEKANWERAERFYGLAVQLGLTAEKMRQTRYRIARAKYERGAAWEAIADLGTFLKEHKTGAFVGDARYTLGRAYQKVSNFSEARKAFRDFLDEHSDHALAAKAAFRIVETFRLPRPHSNAELERGVRAARAFLEKFANHALASKAHLWIGEAFAHRSRHEEAAQALREVIERYAAPPLTAGTKSPEDIRAQEKTRARVARAKVRLGDVLRAQRKYPAAIETWRAYLRDHPADRDWERAQRAVLDVELEIASEHYLAKRYDAAKEAWQSFAARYPLDHRNPQVMRLLGQIEYDQGRFAEAVKAWRALVSKYRNTHDGSRAHFTLAVTLADKLRDFEGALKELESVSGAFSSQASERLTLMKEESLKVVTERVFGTNEPPVVKMTVRNLPKVSARLYKVDMEQFFRRKHTLTGVEDLDLALIAPDKAWEIEVAGHAKWKESEQNIEIPTREPGVYAVTVGGGKLEATTIVQVTDMAIILKATRRDLIVMALDRKSGNAFAGAQILVSDGQKIVLEGKTGADGVWRKRDAEIEKLSSATVFAEIEGHVAGTTTGSIAGSMNAIKPSALVYTDRPAYQPGSQVHLRAIVRRAHEGRFVYAAGETYELTVSAPGGQAILKRDAALDEFGTLSADVELDANAPLGYYAIALRQKVEKDAATFSGSFRVQSYRLEKVNLEVLYDRPVFMRGEKVAGRIRARYQFGEPVAGKKVTFQLAQEGVEHSAVLDDQGEARFSFETRNFDWDQTLNVTANLVDEGVSANTPVKLATEEFSASAKAERAVYLAGDEALITIAARSVEDKPVATRFLVDVFVRAPVAQAKAQVGIDPFTAQAIGDLSRPSAGETRVGQVEVQTDAQGKALVRQRLAKGGEYVFRARAIDRFGNAIVAETHVTVSGDDDQVRLRLFDIAGEYKVGQDATIRIHSRTAKGELALVTFHAEGVVEHRIVRLVPGENAFRFTLRNDHAPNVRLHVALLDGRELREASADLSVQRALKVVITPEAKVVRPGQKTKVRIAATDHNGAPARASISLAIVDEALFQLFPDTIGEIARYFYGQLRDTSVTVAGSGTYRHEGRTKSLSAELLEEDARRSRDEAKKMAKESEASEKPKGAIFDAPATAAPAPPPPPAANGQLSLGGVGSGSGGYGYGKIGRRMRPSRIMLGQQRIATKSPGVTVRARFLELAHWSPSVVTNDQGHAEVEVTMPDNTTTWRLTSRGVTTETLVGDAKAELVSKRDFFVEARVPGALTEGDVVKPLVRVHNYSGQASKASVTMKVKLGQTTTERSATTDVPARGTAEARLDGVEASGFQFGAKQRATIATRAEAGSLSDEERVSVPLRAWGTERRVGASGRSGSTVNRILELPSGTYAFKSMRIDLGPPPHRLLVEMALSRQGLFSPSPASTVQWLLITHHVLEYLRALGRGGLDAERLETQLRSLAQSIQIAQRSDGGVSWIGQSKSHPFVSADALRALILAREAGASVSDDVVARLVTYVAERFRALSESNHAAKAALLHSLAHVRETATLSAAGVDVFAFANRLYRVRASLPLAALAHLTLALDRMGRKDEVAVLARALASRVGAFDAVGAARYDADHFKVRPWFRDNVTLVALIVDAIQRGAATNAKVKQGVEWLLARRYGVCWFSPRLTQAAVQSLARYYGTTQFTADRYRVAVRVNDQLIQEVDVVADGSLQSVDVPPKVLADGANKLSLDLSGRGEFTYSVMLRGVTRGIDTADEGKHLVVNRTVEPAPRRLEGKALARGFSNVTNVKKTWKNPLTQLPVGERAQVALEIRADEGGRQGYLVVEEPIPAGTRVDPESIRGGFLHHEVRPDRIVFFVQESRSWLTRISYDLFGVIPGSYRVLPTTVYGAYDPAYLSTGKPGKLEVLAKGQSSSDPYTATPDEDLDHGRRLFELERHEAAVVPLERLLAGHGTDYTLRDEAYKDAVRMLLFASLAQKQQARVVRYFEIVREKYPELVISLQKSVDIGEAYMSMREWERGHQVLRATLEASFNVESQVGGALDSAGEAIESVRFMRELVNHYPDLPAVQSALYGLGQHITDLERRAQTDPNLKRFKLEKGALLADAIRIFWEFRGLYPDNLTVDEAAFALANAYLGREEHKDVMELTRRLRQLHQKSSFLDGYEYIEGLAAFALERYDHALELCRKVSSGKYYNERKVLSFSSNRDLAILIMGQIFHALGNAVKAIERYKKVVERFPDAREAIQNFERASLQLPEVTTARPGDKVTVEVRFRNVTEAQLIVYKVDLMKLYLLHRDLNNITRVNLAGIKPKVEETLTLARGLTYRDVEKRVRLPLREKGAYLVVLKSKEVEASGMVLVTDLALEVKEDSSTGRVRVHALDRRTSKPVRKVFVRVVGSADGQFQGAMTDLRGVYVADGVRGKATVIAAKGSSYAFHRGELYASGATPPAQKQHWQNMPAAPAATPAEPLYKELENRNIRIQQRAKRRYDEQLRNESKGVQVDQMK